ncbi:hypothetical protein CPC08DRAFT_732033 [Agrocybe pediades]|nr:hypothetical protein CPC08DRAFT_732033 [Agrocybe pediades]
MIQATDLRRPQTSVSATSTRQDASDPLVWGKWIGRRHYSLEVVQHPLRARMCGFGDKDRRPLAPAAVAKMIVRREDDSIVDVDEVDCSFFLVTVDLWSADGKQEMNLVLHPSSTERYVPTSTPKSKRKGRGSSPSSQYQAGSSTPSLSAHAPYGNQSYSSSGNSDSNYQSQGFSYGAAPPSDTSPSWNYPPPVDRSAGFPPPILPSIHSFGRTISSSSDNWHSETAEPEILPYRPWSSDAPYAPVDHNVDPSLRAQSSNNAETPNGGSNSSGGQWSQSNPYNSSAAAAANITESDQNSDFTGTPPRLTYTRTLVGPLSANACRLLDEHRKPGIFFLFQDLSVRTEGTFRLRMRLMNVGAPPAPEIGAQRVHNDVSPVLAQIFSEPFTVFSAKRFPGVPDTTALSIAFGNQGQKLPLVCALFRSDVDVG